jgi:transcriptional/translational regulatory protein YebC/TACO1
MDRAPLWLEAYGPHGTVLLLACAPDDPARTRAAIRSLLKKLGGQLGAPGSIAYLFRQSGVIGHAPGSDAARVDQVSAHLAARGAGVASDQRVLWRTERGTALTGDPARGMLQLLLELQRRDDVWSVYSNVEIPDEIVAEL